MFSKVFKSNLSLIIGHLTDVPTYDIFMLEERATDFSNSNEFRYITDNEDSSLLKERLVNDIYRYGAAQYLAERAYAVLPDEELVNLLDALRDLIIFSCKKTMLKQSHYILMLFLNSFTNKGILGSCATMAAESVAKNILCKIKTHSLNGFKEYLRRFV